MTPWQIALLIIAVVAAWLLFWCAVVMLIARFGWRRLAAAYPGDRAIYEGPRFRMQSVGLKRWVSYSGCVTFTVERDGLLMEVLWLFRPGHAPVFLPWSELDVTYDHRRFLKTRLVIPVAELRPRREPGVPITIKRALADRLAAAAGGRWPGPRTDSVDATGSPPPAPETNDHREE
jgi:hypothetical protein